MRNLPGSSSRLISMTRAAFPKTVEMEAVSAVPVGRLETRSFMARDLRLGARSRPLLVNASQRGSVLVGESVWRCRGDRQWSRLGVGITERAAGCAIRPNRQPQCRRCAFLCRGSRLHAVVVIEGAC